MTPEQLKSLHDLVDVAYARGFSLHVSAFPRDVASTGHALNCALDIGPATFDSDAGEDGAQEVYSWWAVSATGLRLTVHQGTDPGPDPVADRTQVDRSTPYESPVTVAATPHSRYGTDAGIE